MIVIIIEVNIMNIIKKGIKLKKQAINLKKLIEKI